MKPTLITTLLFTTLTITPTLSHAFFCPSNFSQIDIGNTIDQVKQLCGKPDKETAENPPEKVPQEWVYYIPQQVGMSNTALEQGTLKTSMSFDADGKAINISVNGIGVGSTMICAGKNIALGETKEVVEKACGKPSVINKSQNTSDTSANTPPPENKIIKLFYNATPPVVLVFEHGILTSRE